MTIPIKRALKKQPRLGGPTSATGDLSRSSWRRGWWCIASREVRSPIGSEPSRFGISTSTGPIIDSTHIAAMKRAEDVMSELADGTGGAFFHNSNDLGAGFKSLTDAPEVVYLLELSPDVVKPDGSYHRLQVKVDREGMRLQARQGYSAPKQEKNKK
jgi:hypothetical protein